MSGKEEGRSRRHRPGAPQCARYARSAWLSAKRSQKPRAQRAPRHVWRVPVLMMTFDEAGRRRKRGKGEWLGNGL
jgi:hypothetical protein